MDDVITRISKLCDFYCNSSVKSFAESINCTQQSVDKYLKGETRSPMSFVVSILSAYPLVSAEWLLRGEGLMTKHADSKYNLVNSPAVNVAESNNYSTSTINCGNNTELVGHLQDRVNELESEGKQLKEWAKYYQDKYHEKDAELTKANQRIAILTNKLLDL